MKRIHRSHLRACLVVLLVAVVPGVSVRAQERQTPRPEVQRIVQAIVDAVNGGDRVVDKLVKEVFTAEYRAARTTEQRRQWFEPIRAKYGKIAVNELRRTAADSFIAVATGDKDAKVHFVVTHDDKFLVKGLGLEEPGG